MRQAIHDKIVWVIVGSMVLVGFVMGSTGDFRARQIICVTRTVIENQGRIIDLLNRQNDDHVRELKILKALAAHIAPEENGEYLKNAAPKLDTKNPTLPD